MGAVAEVQEVAQHMQALERANKVRLDRAELKRKIKRGETSVREVLADTPPEAANMEVMDLLMAATGWGPGRSRRALRLAGAAHRWDAIPELKPVGELTQRQRDALSRLV